MSRNMFPNITRAMPISLEVAADPNNSLISDRSEGRRNGHGYRKNCGGSAGRKSADGDFVGDNGRNGLNGVNTRTTEDIEAAPGSRVRPEKKPRNRFGLIRGLEEHDAKLTHMTAFEAANPRRGSAVHRRAGNSTCAPASKLGGARPSIIRRIEESVAVSRASWNSSRSLACDDAVTCARLQQNPSWDCREADRRAMSAGIVDEDFQGSQPIDRR